MPEIRPGRYRHHKGNEHTVLVVSRQEDGAAEIVSRADVCLCVGTSLQVCPANSLIFATPRAVAHRLVS